MTNSSIWSIDGTLTGTSDPGLGGPRNKCIKGVLSRAGVSLFDAV